MNNRPARREYFPPIVIKTAFHPFGFGDERQARSRAWSAQGGDVMAGGQCLLKKMTANESCAAGDENFQALNLSGKKFVNSFRHKFHHRLGEPRVDANEQRLVHDGVSAL